MTGSEQLDEETEHEYTIAPQHGPQLKELDPYIIEGVAYSPLKMTYKHCHDESLELRCDSCEWTTAVGELPEDAGRVQPRVQRWITSGPHNQYRKSLPMHECPHCGEYSFKTVQERSIYRRWLLLKKIGDWHTEYEHCHNCGHQSDKRTID